MSEENTIKLEEMELDKLKEMLSEAVVQLGQIKYFHSNAEKDMETVANDIRLINHELMRRDDAEKAAAANE